MARPYPREQRLVALRDEDGALESVDLDGAVHVTLEFRRQILSVGQWGEANRGQHEGRSGERAAFFTRKVLDESVGVGRGRFIRERPSPGRILRPTTEKFRHTLQARSMTM